MTGLRTADKYPRWGCTSVKHSAKIPSFDQLAVLCLMHSRMRFALLAARAHTAGPYWASCLPAPQSSFCGVALQPLLTKFGLSIYPDPSARALVPQESQHSGDWLPDIYSPSHCNPLRALPSSHFFAQYSVSLFILHNIWTSLSRRILWQTVLKDLPKIQKNYTHCWSFNH